MKENLDMADEAPEIETVRTTRVSCDGGVLGHPKVWYEIPQDVGWVECGYCDKRFVFQAEEPTESQQ